MVGRLVAVLISISIMVAVAVTVQVAVAAIVGKVMRGVVGDEWYAVFHGRGGGSMRRSMGSEGSARMWGAGCVRCHMAEEVRVCEGEGLVQW